MTTDAAVRSTTQYLLPSPAGALRAVSGERSPQRDLLRALLRPATTIALTEPELRRSLPQATSFRAIELVTELHRRRQIDLHPRPYRLGEQKVEDALPRLLDRLSADGRGLLADNEGFLVSSVGVPGDQATRLAALASELVAVNGRWRDALGEQPGASPPAWWASPTGTTRYGLVVLTVGGYPFVLVLEGEIQLMDPAFVWLVWALHHRYDRGPLEL